MNNRESNMDTLRVFACILVVTLHCTVPFLIANMNDFNSNFAFSSILAVFTRVSVPIFIMISGRYIISNLNNLNISEFYKKRLPRILIPFIFWNIFYGIVSCILTPDVTPYLLLTNFLNGGTSIHLWFLYLMLGLYILTPVIYKIKEKISPKNFMIFSFILLFIGFGSELLRSITQFKNIPLYYPVEFIGYYLVGYTLKDIKFENKTKFLLFGYIGLCLLGAILSLLAEYNGSELAFYFHTSLNPPTLLATLCLYLYFNSITLTNFKFSNLSKYTLGIYGFHMFFLVLIMHLTDNSITNIVAIDILLYISITFILSLLTSKVLYKFKLTRKFVS